MKIKQASETLTSSELTVIGAKGQKANRDTPALANSVPGCLCCYLVARSLRRIHYFVEVVAGSQSGYCNNQQLWALLKAAIALNELNRLQREFTVRLPQSSRTPENTS